MFKNDVLENIFKKWWEVDTFNLGTKVIFFKEENKQIFMIDSETNKILDYADKDTLFIGSIDDESTVIKGCITNINGTDDIEWELKELK
jgi:hypothetical protein